MAAFIEIPWKKMSHCSWLAMGPILCDFVDQWQSDSPLPASSTCLPIHRPLSLSKSHKLCARLAISTAEIWDACNYRAIYSNQLDPNLYFPAAPAGLLASSYLPGRCSPHFCFLIRFPLALFQQGGKRRSSCDTGLRRWKVSKCKHGQTVNSNGAQRGSSNMDVFFFINYIFSCLMTHSFPSFSSELWVFKAIS